MAELNSILLFGREARLIETRQWILERAGYKVRAVLNLEGINQVEPATPVDVIILCHTLSQEDCTEALELAQSRWPEAKKLVLVAGPSSCPTREVEEVLDAMEGPAKFVAAVEKLAGPASNARLSA